MKRRMKTMTEVREKKVTKAMMFEAVREVVEASDAEMKVEMVEFIDKQLEQLAAKAEKAKARAAEKKVAGDELREVVKSVLTDEFQTIDAITAQIVGEDVTKAKVTARLTQLIKSEEAVKEQVKAGSRKVMAYKLA
jgi:hypothetical protein